MRITLSALPAPPSFFPGKAVFAPLCAATALLPLCLPHPTPIFLFFPVCRAAVGGDRGGLEMERERRRAIQARSTPP